MANYLLKYPVMQIRPYGLLVYERVEWPSGKRKSKKEHLPAIMHVQEPTPFEAAAGQAQYKGKMTSGARKRLKRAIQLIVAIALPKKAMNFRLNKEFTFKLNFVTLTLPGQQGFISDKDIKKHVLDIWLKAAKRRFRLNSYIWRAERQKNGNLHFHIVTDTYIPYDQLRDTWNQRLNKLGFIDRFEQLHGHRHPNSTDVHSIGKVKHLAQYFSKYMAKDEKEGQEIDGKVWDCSKNLKTKTNCEMLLEGEALEAWTRSSNDPDVKVKHSDHCSIAFLIPAQFDKYICGSLDTAYQSWLSSIRNIPDESPPQIPEPVVYCPF